MNDGHGLILPSDTSSVCSEWESMRMKHPFMGEGLEDGEIKDIWESSASNYSDNWYRSIKDEILCHLSESGIVHGKASVIDIEFAALERTQSRSAGCVVPSYALIQAKRC